MISIKTGLFAAATAAVTGQPVGVQRYRAIWISDLHLGTRE